MGTHHPPLLESLEPRQLLSATVIDHILTITGSNKSDQIIVDQTATAYTLSFNGKQSTITDLPLLGIKVDAKAGNDHVLLNVNIPTSINGGAGNDSLTGGIQADHLQGGPGNDVLTGNDGDDVLQGDQGNDILYGGNGADYLSGGQGDDLLDSGAGIDQTKGGPGNDDTLQENDAVSDENKADKGKNHTPRLKIQPINSVRTSTGTIQLTNPSVWVTQPGAGSLIGGSITKNGGSAGTFEVSGATINFGNTNPSNLLPATVSGLPPLSGSWVSLGTVFRNGALATLQGGTFGFISPITISTELFSDLPATSIPGIIDIGSTTIRVENNADIQPGNYQLIGYSGQQLTDLSRFTLDTSALPSIYNYTLILNPDTPSIDLVVTLPTDPAPADPAPSDPSSPT
jgi:hypothetical protein